ncbi:MAG: hydrogenase maturation protease [Betaproteobacteria bacterium]|nr:hydrogenase maturation protease [Betaproteobacteria bacterium]
MVFACGNPSRGDDALGPAFIDRVEALLADEIRQGELELLTDFQLQAEHALDLVGRAQVVFVDASVACAAPFTWTEVQPARDVTWSTHVMSPAAVLATFRAIDDREPPPCRLLAIRGRAFELGAPLSAAAADHLAAAVDFFVGWFADRAGNRAPAGPAVADESRRG